MRITSDLPRGRIDWPALRNRLDLAAVATHFLGPAPGRRGERGRRLWWPCPFHDDDNPSLVIDPGKPWYRCYGCDARGDAANLVMHCQGMSFPEAIRWLADFSGETAPRRPAFPQNRKGAAGSAPSDAVSLQTSLKSRDPARGRGDAPIGVSIGEKHRTSAPGNRGRSSNKFQHPPEAPRKPAAAPRGLPDAEARSLVEAASAALWTPEGAETLAYLRVRGLTDDTIRAAGLGWTRRAEGVAWKPPGLVIPWTDGGRLRMVKIRPPDAWRDRFPGGRKPPKYIEAFRDRPGLYVARPPVPGHPLVVCEGELDALLIAQESAAWPCAVVTGGSASFRPDAALAGSLVSSFPWILAHDADEAGDRAAEAWKALAPGRCRRLRPPIDPAGGKDWGDIHGAAFNAIRYHLAPLLSAGPSWEALDTQSRAEVSDADEPDDIQSGD